MPTALPNRDQVHSEDTWSLEDLYENDTLFEASLKKAKEELNSFSHYEGKLTTDAHLLLEFLKKQEHFEEQLGKLYIYSHMRLHQDGGNAFYQTLSSKTESLALDAGATFSFVNPEFTELTPEKLSKFYSECPELALYTRYFNEILREKKHILDQKTEALLARVSEIGATPQNTFAMLNNVDLQFPNLTNAKGEKVPLTHGTYISLMENKDRSLREKAFTSLYETYSQYKNTIASLFSANIKQYGLFSTIRGYESPLHAALSTNNIPIEVYNNLIDTVNENLDALHDYISLRRDVLSLDSLHMYDLFVPMVKDFEKPIPFEEACETILKALEPLGPDYVHMIQEGFNNRWIDKYENKGKRSGAYSWSTYGSPHPYVLMNYTNNVNNMFTLAHEMGHAMHSYLSHKTQPQVYADYCIFVAEVASTVNEALLMQYLLKTTTDGNYKRYLLNYFMEQFRSTLYRQTMFAEFERDMHLLNQQGTPLTAELLCQKYYELVKRYHGEAIHVDSLIANEWTRIPHFYSPFYVYQYATGYSAAIAISTRILEEGDTAVKDYLDFLSGGSSKDPIDLLKIAGVDMSSPTPIQNALKQFKYLINQFKKLDK